MAEKSDQLTPEEIEVLARVESDHKVLEALIEELSGHSRRKRQLVAHVVKLLAEREPELLGPYVDDLVDALERPEAQTRWEVLDACTLLVPQHAKELSGAYDGAEAALFDELSATLRFSAFRFLAAWGATERGRSKKVWPVIDEAIQCYHGDLEYPDMLISLSEFAQGKIDGSVASELAGRIKFDAENGKGAYIKPRSAEIYEALVKRFKIKDPKKRARVTPKDDGVDEDEE